MEVKNVDVYNIILEEFLFIFLIKMYKVLLSHANLKRDVRSMSDMVRNV